MKVIEAGHIYRLDNLAAPGEQELVFCRRSSGAIDYGEFEHAGTNTQEVLRVLIDRSLFLNSVLPCSETLAAINHLRLALHWYEVRAWRRKRQKLNKSSMTHKEEAVPAFGMTALENMPVGRDGHIIFREE